MGGKKRLRIAESCAESTAASAEICSSAAKGLKIEAPDTGIFRAGSKLISLSFDHSKNWFAQDITTPARIAEAELRQITNIYTMQEQLRQMPRATLHSVTRMSEESSRVNNNKVNEN
jgi:hypothetical protein